MGGNQSSPNEKIQTNNGEKKNIIITQVEENEEEIFNKISDLTKEILIKYSDMHLDENFCNNLSIIYQEKLNTFKIKLLRDIYDKISGKKIQYDLLLVNNSKFSALLLFLYSLPMPAAVGVPFCKAISSAVLSST